MFKVRILTLSVVLGLVLTLAGVVGINKVEEATRERVLHRLSQTKEPLARAFESRRVEQAFLAALLAKSELVAAMAVLDEVADDLQSAWNQAYSQVPGTDARAVGEREKLIRETKKDEISLPDYFAQRFAEYLERLVGIRYFAARGLQVFLNEQAERLTKCAAFGGLDQCKWDFTYNTLPHVFVEIAKTYQMPPEKRVYVIDAEGVGRADSSNPQWSGDKEFATRTVLPSEAVKKRSLANGIVQIGDRYFFATALPLYFNGNLLGAVMVGEPIDERVAQEDSILLGAEVAYAVGQKVVASRIPANLAEKLLSDPKGVDERVASILSLEGANPYELRAVVSEDLRPLLARYSSARATLVLIGLFCTLVAIGILIWFLRSFYAAFELLDQGVHEVINGNLDFQFPFDFKEEIARGLGQSLNIMSLVLQGRPLPEDVEEQEAGRTAWMAEVQVSQAEPEWGEQESRPTVAFNFEAARALAAEPADVYYKRIYSEFLQARRSLGLSNEGITYPKFLERLVHLEQGLKKRHKCPMVRFKVVVRDGAVVLDPVPIAKLP